MMFKSLVLAALLADQSSASSLRVSRKLSFTSIGGYEPRSLVTDHNALDRDQSIMMKNLADGTPESFGFAQSVYVNGGNSKSYAILTVPALTTEIPEDTPVLGKNANEVQIKGTVMEKAKVNDVTIKVQYDTITDQDNYVTCQVGALAAFGGETTDGCFAATGTITAGTSTPITYSYDPAIGNQNGRSISGFSTNARSKMLECSGGCPYPDFVKFNKYYGTPDYAHKWVTAAFSGGVTPSFSNGNGDFSQMTFTGRTEIVQKGTVTMHFWMYVIREFEDALDDCKLNCMKCNDDPVHAWDEGVAFYTGSLEGTDGSGDGKLLYALADKRCKNFKTCGAQGNAMEGMSKVNYDLLELFALGQEQLLVGDCPAARKTKERIAKKMAIPLVQGTLRYAYIVDKQSGGEKEKAEGTAFAAAVLPIVHHCNPMHAKVIYDNMKTGATSTSFSEVKRAFESVYGCMQIDGAEVGGLVNPATSEYYAGAEPNVKSDDDDKPTPLALGLGITGLIIFVLFVGGLLMMCCGKRSSGIESKGTAGQEMS